MSGLGSNRGILRRVQRKLEWRRAAGQIRTEAEEKKFLSREVKREIQRRAEAEQDG